MEISNRNWKMENSHSGPIKSFHDLRVYQNLYQVMIIVLKEILPTLPKEEKYDLKDQMRRACKAGPALMAEGFAKRFQKKNWEKYINDTIGECNEMIHHLSICIDVYGQFTDTNLCKKAIDIYDISCKQLTNLKKAWTNYHNND